MGASSPQVVQVTQTYGARLTNDIPFTPMEAKVNNRIEAKLADDTDVNLTA